MTLFRLFAALALTALPLSAQETLEVGPVAQWQEDHQVVFDGSEVTLDQFQWIARPVVIFADTPADPRFQQQMDYIIEGIEDLADRDVVVIVDTSPETLSSVREQLRPRGFMLAIIGKDGTVQIRKPLPWTIREISRNIDKLPLRLQEVEDRRESAG